jgi:glutathione S-transferase
MNAPFPRAAMATPTLYQFAECHECGLVRRLLRQYQVPFEAVTLPVGDKSLVRAKFGSQSVPVLQDGPFLSNDLAEICRHIEQQYGAAA